MTKADDFHVRPEDIANQKKRTKADAGPQKVKFDQAYVKQPCSKLNFCAFVSWLSGTVMQDVYIYIFTYFNSCALTRLRKLCQYFGEDKDGDSLQADWNKASPNDKEAKQGGLDCL